VATRRLHRHRASPPPCKRRPQLLASGALPLRQRLQIILTAAAILRGQGEALNIDRRTFYTQLYTAALLAPMMPLVEDADSQQQGQQQQQQQQGKQQGKQQLGQPPLNGKRRQREGEGEEGEDAAAALAEDLAAIAAAGALTGGDPSASGAAALLRQLQQPAAEAAPGRGGAGPRGPEPTAVLLVRAMDQLLLGVKQTDAARLAAFTKRLVALMLQVRPARRRFSSSFRLYGAEPWLLHRDG
jgi:nucleolar complex protein 3